MDQSESVEQELRRRAPNSFNDKNLFSSDSYIAAKQIDDLLKIANRQISRFKRSTTLLVLRATAGLRLLNETNQQQIFQAVNQTFIKYGFYQATMDIAIMNEAEEGTNS
ncbi:unnamed protein product [Rotaria sp. Silwood2]|nr:unnamed protein product [Rotaria sp. Silwood2]